MYPESPFIAELIPYKLFNTDTIDSSKQIQNEDYVKTTLKWLCTSPRITTYRVNTLTHSTGEILGLIEKYLTSKSINIKIEKDSYLDEVIVLQHNESRTLNLENINNEVIVDTNCGAAILRGANIYAPGVMAMTSGTRIGEKVKIFADLRRKCKKGLQKEFIDQGKTLIGIGIVKMNRHQLYGDNIQPTGVAVEVVENISGCPVIGTDILPTGSALLQNLPSITCVHNLNPLEGETVLDMCAAPGNKTTHIAALMKNKGMLIAVDKSASRVVQLKQTCDDFKVNVKIMQCDSTKLWPDVFPEEVFDRILLDAPCSGLGQRPQLCNSITAKVLDSYVPLQRKLFQNAVPLLKPNGTLVYSTCTINTAENEGIIAWALETFSCLNLIPCHPHLGSSGLQQSPLKPEHRRMVQRFGPESKIDSIGFFIARFIKK